MMEDYATDVERLKSMVLSAATDGIVNAAMELEFGQIRTRLVRQERFKKLAPRFVLVNSTAKDIRRAMQAISEHYGPRRNHINDGFADLINSLFDGHDPAFHDNPVAAIARQVNVGPLVLLPLDVQTKGKEMADVYVELYCIENVLRVLIDSVMKDEELVIPRKVQNTIAKLKEQERSNAYLPVRGNSDLFYCDFSDLQAIMVGNWSTFGIYFPDQNEHWLNVTLGELYKIRNLVAHNSYVGQDERDALKVHFKAITKQLRLNRS